jgi:D-arabinose 1-dehydrogenase-like Zn-dependent alcohol dehydrogenase
MKIFRGTVMAGAGGTDYNEDGGELLDSRFTSAVNSTLRYPVRYGYSLVGTVVDVGCNLSRAEWIGERVFAFAPHTSVAVVNVADVQLLPADVTFEDAAFLPAVETTVSLLMAAKPLVGEKLGIVGLGLIGQLTAAIARVAYPAVQLVLVDAREDRLALARQGLTGGGEVEFALAPNLPATQANACDVSIEVSGRLAGLQTALALTGQHGRVILGSWYDCADPHALALGTRFHRSDITLQACQVSHIPPGLAGRWSKQRRFAVAWGLLRRVRPAHLLEKHCARANISSQGEVQNLFQSLVVGKCISGILSADQQAL